MGCVGKVGAATVRDGGGGGGVRGNMEEMDKGVQEEGVASRHGDGTRMETGVCGGGGIGMEVRVDEVGWR